MLRRPYNNKWEHFSKRVVSFISLVVKGFENLQYMSIGDYNPGIPTLPDLKKALYSFGFKVLNPGKLGLDHGSG
jgi:L-fucose isomerase-like protein